MKIIFAGTPDFAKTQLKALVEAGYDIVLVLTQPDRPSGRGQKMNVSAVKAYAQEQGLRVEQPASLKDETIQSLLASLESDLMVVSAYGLLIPEAVLNLPKRGCWNVHGSLLPHWRGASPIQHSILHGDTLTGVTLMQMDKGLDTGDMLLKKQIPVGNHTGASMHDALATLGADCLLEGLAQIDALEPERQDDSQASYAHKIKKSDGELRFAEKDATFLERKVRAFYPWPGSWFTHQGQVLKVGAAHLGHQKGKPGEIIQANKDGVEVGCQQGSIVMTHIQFPGKKMLAVGDLLNARKTLFVPGELI